MATLQFHGGAGTVTGSCFQVNTKDLRFLVDCGLFQGSKEIKERNYGPFPFDPSSIQFLLLTHAHIDHSGLIPKLVKAGFSGPIFSTEGTRDLCQIMLPDSGHIQVMEVERKNRKARRAGRPPLEPIYTVYDAGVALDSFQAVQYGQVIAPAPGVRIRFLDAGHILGSATIEVWLMQEDTVKMVFSGDIGPGNRPIVADPDEMAAADYVVMESTYGSRLRPPEQDLMDQFEKATETGLARGGNIIIPAFAVERTQDTLYTIQKLKLQGRFPDATVYLDSPMAQAATDVFCRHYEVYDDETRELADRLGRCPFYPSNLVYSRSTEESMALNQLQGGAIIISASGMCDAGRVKHHLKHNLWKKEATILLVGYQASGTLGRRLQDGAKSVRIHGEEVAVRATIETLDCFTAHADQRGLLSWLSGFQARPVTTFLTHGEAESSLELAHLIQQELNLEVMVPNTGDLVHLGRGRTSLERTPTTPQEMEAQAISRLEEAYLNLGDHLRRFLWDRSQTPGSRQQILTLLEDAKRAISKETAPRK